MPVPPKPGERRQRRNARPSIVVRRGARAVELPPAPRGLLRVTVERWEVYWSSPIGQLADPQTDLPAIERLFSLLDERERAYRSYKKRRVVKGSTGQPVINPAWKHVPIMDAEIRQLEDRLGLTPQSRLKLGVTFGAAARSLEDLNRDLTVDDEGHDAQDPRLSIAR